MFLSPPWGGPFYKFSDFFDVTTPMEGLGVSLAELIKVGNRTFIFASFKSRVWVVLRVL